MALNIKDAETDRLARELARLTGETITVAARTAIEERLARVVAAAGRRSGPTGLDAVIARGRARADLTHRTADEIVGYDADGLPA